MVGGIGVAVADSFAGRNPPNERDRRAKRHCGRPGPREAGASDAEQSDPEAHVIEGRFRKTEETGGVEQVAFQRVLAVGVGCAELGPGGVEPLDLEAGEGIVLGVVGGRQMREHRLDPDEVPCRLQPRAQTVEVRFGKA